LLVLAAIAVAISGVNAAHYGVLVAGSNQFYNYRHQTDICHSFHVLTQHGIPKENVIVMVYDDIANDPQNPYPGQLFNKPTDAQTPGVDVYAGCKKDYTGDDVTAQNFLYVLTGNSTAVPAGHPVLQSGPNDNVFIFFSDHGGTGIIAFPAGPFLQATDLNAALEYMYNNKMYKKLVFYLEACESGSMFEGILPTNQNIYVTTASNAQESSWGTYCPPDDYIQGKEINSCLGDLYSVNWMEDADKAGSMKETLQTQFLTVQQETTQSHVMQYGETDWTSMPVGAFEGNTMSAAPKTSTIATQKRAKSNRKSVDVDSRDAKLHYNYYKYVRAEKKGMAASHAAARELIAEVESRIAADVLFTDLTRSVAGVERAERMLTQHVAKPSTCSSCCKEVMEALRTECDAWNDYSLKYTRVAVNLCHHVGNTATGTKHILNTVSSLCKAQ
jgi:legumain